HCLDVHPGLPWRMRCRIVERMLPRQEPSQDRSACSQWSIEALPTQRLFIHLVDDYPPLDETLPRLVGPALAARLGVMPAVIVTGARQSGGGTPHLVRRIRPYLSGARSAGPCGNLVAA